MVFLNQIRFYLKNLLSQVEGLSNLVEDLRTLSLFENQQLKT